MGRIKYRVTCRACGYSLITTGQINKIINHPCEGIDRQTRAVCGCKDFIIAPIIRKKR